jgi:hypothetical protein
MKKKKKIPPTKSVANSEERVAHESRTASTAATDYQSAAQPSTDNLQPTTEEQNMEVHHHGHIHSKSKWKEYIFQFFMLFLAVFCGFLAEYQLEHKIERDREQTYMQSMIEDLEKDTVNLSGVIKQFQRIDLHLDTMLKFYPALSEGYTEVFFRNFRSLRGYPDFIYSDRTMTQLKNSGAMRLIRNKKVVDGIVNYDSNIRDLVNIDISALDNDFTTTLSLTKKLVDYGKLEMDLNSKSSRQMEDEKSLYLLKNDMALLGELNNYIRDLKEIYIAIKEKEIALKNEATALIALIKKEYEFE